MTPLLVAFVFSFPTANLLYQSFPNLLNEQSAEEEAKAGKVHFIN